MISELLLLLHNDALWCGLVVVGEARVTVIVTTRRAFAFAVGCVWLLVVHNIMGCMWVE